MKISHNQGQVSLLGILVLLAVLSSTFGTIAQMHWLLLKMKARSQVYLCHAKLAEESEQYVHFIGRTNSALRALSLVPPTPATAAKVMALRNGLQLSQKFRSVSFLQKLRTENACSVKNILHVTQESPFRNFQRHPVDGTLLLQKPEWNYQLQAGTGGPPLGIQDFRIYLRGSFKLADRFGSFTKGKLYEVL
ncbi:MAG: hypothetical protein A2X86_18660 [Bdellovibrionales bacterium GWA2_49_15]|nr:MAG: hypothetical protein A2X86_18660 [Bdellovibrionales bacterium GWA2_49_15]HAZ14249.1 hypothetical protein [Bdellovibrionales bacterium]